MEISLSSAFDKVQAAGAYGANNEIITHILMQKSQSKSVRHWNKTCLPKFSAYLRPLLEGENMQSKTRQRMTAQMRDDVIAFIE